MSKRILVVEDQADTRQIIRDMLASTDYEITEAENGEQALAAKAALKLGLQLNVLHASSDAELDDAFRAFREMHLGALIIGTDAFFNNRLEQLAALAVRNSVPAVYEYHQFVAGGGLASYGGSILDSYGLAGGYVGRILKGEKPADLPVQQASKIELLINLKTAKTLGITVPSSVLNRADEVIE
jgi:putative tryptophan/tyrosine transport system substrate-binding protein